VTIKIERSAVWCRRGSLGNSFLLHVSRPVNLRRKVQPNEKRPSIHADLDQTRSH
jgi:hypothetical protein